MDKVKPVYPIFATEEIIPKDTTRYELCVAAEAVGGNKSIIGVQYLKGVKGTEDRKGVPGIWRFAPKTEEARIQILADGIEVKGRKVFLCDKNPRIAGNEDVQLKIFDLPFSYSNEAIKKNLEAEDIKCTGEVIKEMIRTPDGGLTDWESGDRHIFIKRGEKPVKRKMKMGKFTATLWHRFMIEDQLCTTCWEKGHGFWDCKNERVCKRCLEKGHGHWQCQNEEVCWDCLKSGHKKGDPLCRVRMEGEGEYEEAQARAQRELEKKQQEDLERERKKKEEEEERERKRERERLLKEEEEKEQERLRKEAEEAEELQRQMLKKRQEEAEARLKEREERLMKLEEELRQRQSVLEAHEKKKSEEEERQRINVTDEDKEEQNHEKPSEDEEEEEADAERDTTSNIENKEEEENTNFKVTTEEEIYDTDSDEFNHHDNSNEENAYQYKPEEEDEEMYETDSDEFNHHDNTVEEQKKYKDKLKQTYLEQASKVKKRKFRARGSPDDRNKPLEQTNRFAALSNDETL